MLAASAVIAGTAGVVLWQQFQPADSTARIAPESTRHAASRLAQEIPAAAVQAWTSPEITAVSTENAAFSSATAAGQSAAHDHDCVDHADHQTTEAKEAKGRRGTFDAGSFANLGDLKRGDVISIPLFDGQSATGRVNLVQPDANDWIRIGGEISDQKGGSFVLATNGSQVSARIILAGKETAYEVFNGTGGLAMLEEKPLGNVVCEPIPQQTENTTATGTTSTAAAAAVPLFDSRPDAVAVAYLDFDGETVVDPDWNNGNPIEAAPSTLSETQISTVCKRVAEDFAPFNISITTDVTRYNNAPVGKRMRCIVTPTDTAASGAGGVAYLNSFSRAGSGFSSTIPCWTFNTGVTGVVEATSHEIGHTLGLRHDGRTSPAEGYYGGHGTGAVSWGPIMGASYSPAVTQWSKGEYLNANNKEDDIAIISGSTNGFGFAADEAGGTTTTAAPLNAPNGTVSQQGVISSSGDIDLYVANIAAGAVTINANPAPLGGNADLLLELLDSTGAVVASANPDLALNATLTYTAAAGVHYVRVSGTGRGSVTGDGYSSYGSIGRYTLSGTIPGTPMQSAPVITSAGSASGTAGIPFSYQITATNAPESYTATGLPAGLTINASTGLISGTPTAAGSANVAISATNPAGTGTATLAMTITSAATDTFANTAPITLYDGRASVYPSPVTVSNVSGSVTGVTVSLKGLSHTYPDDLDVLLVGPLGQKVMLMSDHGGSRPVNGVNLTFSGSAASTLPDSSQIISGTFRPGNVGSYDSFAYPAPSGSTSTSLSVYNNLNPNGQWRLFIMDDARADTGRLAEGWSLKFTTAAPLAANGLLMTSQPDGSATLTPADANDRPLGSPASFGPFPGWSPVRLTGAGLVWRDQSGAERTSAISNN